MKRVEVMSYPRSGSGLVRWLVHSCFKEDGFKFINVHIDKLKNMDTIHEVTYQKNHDINLRTKIRDDRDYVVLIRYPIESVVSYYLLKVKYFGREDTKEGWETFAKERMHYWKKFYEKWVLSDIGDRRIIINYGDLIDNPFEELSRLVAYLDNNNVVRKEDIEKALQERDEYHQDPNRHQIIKRRNNVVDFKYYNQKYFDELEQMVEGVSGVDIYNKTLKTS